MTLILHFGRKINGLVSFLGQSKYSRVLRLSLLPAKYKDSRILRAKPSIRDGVPRSGMLLYLHHRDSKIFFHAAKFDNFKDEKISDFKTVSVSE